MLCPRCKREAVGWPWRRPDVCSPKTWASCIREPEAIMEKAGRCGHCGKPGAAGAAGLCAECDRLADLEERRQMREWRNDSGV